MRYKVGDRVKVQSLERYNKYKNIYGNIDYGCEDEILFTSEMSSFCGQVVTITRVRYIGCVRFYYLAEDKGVHLWVSGMFEGLAEEETVHKWAGLKVELELSKNVIGVSNVESLKGERFMSGFVKAILPPDGYIFKDENGNVINTQKIILEKKKEYNKGTKVRHKTKGMVETVVGLCKVKANGVWVEGIIYEGNDVHTGEPMTFVRTIEDFNENFEII